MRGLQNIPLLLLWVVSGAAGHAAIIVGYDTTNPNGFDGDPSPDLAPVEFLSSIAPLELSRGAGLIPNRGVAFNSSNWSLQSGLELNTDQYISWGWSDSSRLLDLSSMTLQYDVSPTGPGQLAIALSIDGGAMQVIFADSSVDPSDETHTIDLSSFSEVRSAEFRLFGFDAASETGTLDIEEIVDGGRRGILVMGDFSAVPEPHLLGLTCFAAAMFTTVRRRNS